jgi:hypothetical protein
MMSWQLVVALIRRPDLWVEMLRTMFAVAPSGWWRRRPFVPIPDPAYTEWRLITAHGESTSPLQPEELIHYLEWRKRQHRALRRV